MIKDLKTKYYIVLLFMFLTNLAIGQTGINLTGKTYEYIDKLTGSKEAYTFLSNNKIKLVMLSEFNGKYMQDVCFGTVVFESNKIKVSSICDDKEIYPDPLKETFIFDNATNSLITTIHYDQSRRPRIFKQTR
jgi:hypothetical protein